MCVCIGLWKYCCNLDFYFDVLQPNTKRLQSVSGLLAALLAKYTDLQPLAQRAFKTYLKSIYKQKDKEIFDVTKLPIDEYSASLGLPMTPQLRYLERKKVDKNTPEEPSLVPEVPVKKDLIRPKESNNLLEDSEDDETLDLLHSKETTDDKIDDLVYVILHFLISYLFYWGMLGV